MIINIASRPTTLRPWFGYTASMLFFLFAGVRAIESLSGCAAPGKLTPGAAAAGQAINDTLCPEIVAAIDPALAAAGVWICTDVEEPIVKRILAAVTAQPVDAGPGVGVATAAVVSSSSTKRAPVRDASTGRILCYAPVALAAAMSTPRAQGAL